VTRSLLSISPGLSFRRLCFARCTRFWADLVRSGDNPRLMKLLGHIALETHRRRKFIHQRPWLTFFADTARARQIRRRELPDWSVYTGVPFPAKGSFHRSCRHDHDERRRSS